MPTRSAFVGRELELRTLLQAVPEPGGPGSLMLLRGDPGTGKTRLAAEVVDRVEVSGGRSALGRSWAGGGAPPYWPWIGALRALLGRRGTDLADLVGVDVASADRFELFDAVTRVLADGAEHVPLVVVLDDLHDGDVGSLLLARFVAQELDRLSIQLVATYRPLAVVRRPDVAAHLAELERHGRTIELGGLTTCEVAELIGDRDRAPEVQARTGGNPLFVLHEAAPAGRPGAQVALSVQAAVRAWLEPLAEAERTSLRAIALLGPAANDLGHVAALSGHHEDDVRGHLAAAVRSGLLEAVGESGDLVFSHPLIAELLEAELNDDDRARWHLAVARELAGDDSRRSEVASHLVAAGGGHEEEAIEACRGAAAQATASLVHESAVSHLEAACDLLARLPGDVRALRCALLLELGHSRWRASQRTGADDAFAAAFELAVELGDVVSIAESALGGGFQSDYSGEAVGRRSDRATAALDALGDGDRPERARLLASEAAQRFVDPDPRPARELASEALAMARRLGDPVAIGYALVAQQVVEPGPATLARRLGACREIIALGHETGDHALVLQSRFHLIGALLEVGDLRAIDVELAAQSRGVDDIAEPAYERHTWWFRCMRHLLDGHATRAEEAAERGLGASQAADDPDGFLVYGGQLGPIRWLQGRVLEMEPLWLALRRDDPDRPLWAATVAWLWASTGQVDAARGIVAALDPASIVDDRHWLLTMTAAAEAVAVSGDLEHAASYRERLLPYADRVVPIAMGIACWGTVARPLGLLARALGRHDEAVHHLDRAVEVAGRAGARPWLAQAQLDLAGLLMERGSIAEVPKARDLVDQASATISSLGLVGLQGQLDHVGRTWPQLLAGPISQPVTASQPTCGGRPRIAVMGTFEVASADGTIARWTSRKARQLLKLLVARRGTPTGREHLMDLFWPGVDPELLGNRLSVALSTIRRALDPERRQPVDELVVSGQDSVWLRVDNVDIDLLGFLDDAAAVLASARVRRARREPLAGLAPELARVLELYRGDAFADERYASWSQALRGEAQATMVAVARELAAVAEAEDDALTALHAHRRVIEVDPFDEPSHLGVIRVLDALGAHGQAREARARHLEAMTELVAPVD